MQQIYQQDPALQPASQGAGRLSAWQVRQGLFRLDQWDATTAYHLGLVAGLSLLEDYLDGWLSREAVETLMQEFLARVVREHDLDGQARQS